MFVIYIISWMGINLFLCDFAFVWLFKPLYQPSDYNKRMDKPSIRKGLDAITTSLNQLGDTFEKAFEVNLSV
jgi:hypothetical protein